MRFIILSILSLLIMNNLLLSKPRIAILDFNSTGVCEEDAITVTEIFRSKIITSDVFEVLERKHLKNIIEENKLGISGLIEKPEELGKLLGAEYIITGSFMKLGKKLAMTANIIKIETGKIIGSSEIIIENMDSVYNSITILTMELIKSAFGLKNFTFNTETEGYSIELGLNYLSDFNNQGVGFTIGTTYGGGNFWSGFSTTWNFTTITNPIFFGIEKKLIACFGAGNIIFGNKIDGFAFLIGCGAGYDFQGEITIFPLIGGYYKNLYLKFSPVLLIDPSGERKLQIYYLVDIGYSIFLGTEGKRAVEFK